MGKELIEEYKKSTEDGNILLKKIIRWKIQDPRICWKISSVFCSFVDGKSTEQLSQYGKLQFRKYRQSSSRKTPEEDGHPTPMVVRWKDAGKFDNESIFLIYFISHVIGGSFKSIQFWPKRLGQDWMSFSQYSKGVPSFLGSKLIFWMRVNIPNPLFN